LAGIKNSSVANQSQHYRHCIHGIFIKIATNCRDTYTIGYLGYTSWHWPELHWSLVPIATLMTLNLTTVITTKQ